MKKADRKKIAEAIRAGIPHLWNGRGNMYIPYEKSAYVCFAIDRGVGIADTRGAAAQKMIQDRIAPHAVVEDWLEAQGVKNITQRRVQAYRKAWMKSMVEEFSK